MTPERGCNCPCKPQELKIRHDKAWCPDCADLIDQCARDAAEAQGRAA